MNFVKLICYCLFLLLLCYFTYFLSTDYQKNETRNHVSFIIWIIDTVDLFIHETGHLIFGLFGRFIGFLGGSLFQIIIPVITVLVFAPINIEINSLFSVLDGPKHRECFHLHR